MGFSAFILRTLLKVCLIPTKGKMDWSSVSTRVADVPRRPLLFAAGAAATAAGFYCYYTKRGDGEKSTADPEDTTAKQDPECEQATEPALVRSTLVLQVDEEAEAVGKIQKVSSAQLEDGLRVVEEQGVVHAEKHEREKNSLHQEELLKVSLNEEEKRQKSAETIARLEEEKANLTKQVERLREKVEDMKNNLCKAYSERKELRNECVREQKTYSVLQSDYNTVKKTLLYQNKILKKKHRKAVETMSQLEEEKFKLTDQVEELRGTVEDMKNELIKSSRERGELMDKCVRERVAYSILQLENDEIKETLIHQEELLKVDLAEAEKKHQRSVETISQLEEKKTELTKQVEILSRKVEDMKNNLFEASSERDDLVEECVRERKAYSVLRSEYNKLQKTLLYQDNFLKVALAEAKEKHQKAVKTIAQLEKDKSKLANKVEELRGTLENTKNDLFKRNSERDELMDECVRERESYSVLRSEYNKIEKTLLHQDNFLKICLAEAKEKHQKAVETIAQLEKEKSKLTNHFESLRGTVEDMKDELFEIHRECHELKDEADSGPQSGTLERLHREEIQKVSLAEDEKTPGAFGEHCSQSMIQV